MVSAKNSVGAYTLNRQRRSPHRVPSGAPPVNLGVHPLDRGFRRSAMAARGWRMLTGVWRGAH
jgi:hypothetical protein